MRLGDLEGSNWNSLGTLNNANLQETQQLNIGGYTQPLNIGPNTIIGDKDGWVQKLGSNGWKQYVGTNMECGGLPVGVPATPAYSGGILVVPGNDIVGDHRVHLFGLDFDTGKILWSTPLGSDVKAQDGTPAHVLFSPPVIWNGFVYQGLATKGDCPLVNDAGVYKIDITTGQVVAFFPTSQGCLGASVWGGITVDSDTGSIFFGTGNGSCTRAQSLFWLDSNLNLIASWQSQQASGDLDFGGTGVVIPSLGLYIAGQKSGWIYGMDDSTPSAFQAGPKWQQQLFVSADSPGKNVGTIAPLMYDSTYIYPVGGASNDGKCPAGTIYQLQPTDGTVLGEVCLDGASTGGVMGIPGHLFVSTLNNSVDIINEYTGDIENVLQTQSPVLSSVSFAQNQLEVQTLDNIQVWS
jgi:outer membrane protein assembly factor BamB